MNLSVVPPEALEHARLHGEDARFRGGPAADLYALGVLMYQALADGYPFNPGLPPERLLAAITLRMPRAPHWVNPKAPLSLSRITMRLLAKRPEERFESAETLHKALWEASKERTSREWKVALDLPETGPAPISDEEMQERKLDEERALHSRRSHDQGGDDAPLAGSTAMPAAEGLAPTNMIPMRQTRSRWAWERARRPLLGAATACALVVGGVMLAWWLTPWHEALHSTSPHASTQAGPGQEVATPWMPPEARPTTASPEAAGSTRTTVASPVMRSEDSASVKTPTTQPSTTRRAARKVIGAALACSALTGCPGAQVRSPPPSAEACPEGALETMAKWGIQPGDRAVATLFKKPAIPRYTDVREGGTTVRIVEGWLKQIPRWELSGRLIFAERVHGRLTQAQTSEGETLPVCFELEDHLDKGRGLVRKPDGGAETARVFSTVTVRAVRKFE